MVYYFKRYKTTKWKTFWAFLIACVITGIVQVPMIQWTIKFAGQFDIFFKNDFGLPFFSGFTFFFVLMGCYYLLSCYGSPIKKLEFFKTCHVEFCIYIAWFFNLLHNAYPLQCRSCSGYVQC